MLWEKDAVFPTDPTLHIYGDNAEPRIDHPAPSDWKKTIEYEIEVDPVNDGQAKTELLNVSSDMNSNLSQIKHPLINLLTIDMVTGEYEVIQIAYTNDLPCLATIIAFLRWRNGRPWKRS